jgi:hypothetical protein
METNPYFWWVLFFLIFGLICSSSKAKNAKDPSAAVTPTNSFVVNLPDRVDFKNARVTLVVGFDYFTQYASGGGPLRFNLSDSVSLIDKVKVRTAGGKEYNYSELTAPGSLNVEPIVCYDCDLVSLFK